MLQHHRPFTPHEGSCAAKLLPFLKTKTFKCMNKPKPIQYGLLFYMKVTLIHSLIVSLSAIMAHAIDSSGQEVLDRKVTIQVENTEVKSVLLLLEEKAGVSFTYRPKLIQADTKVSINFKNATLADVLANILNSDISLKIVGNQIALKKKDLTEAVLSNETPDGSTELMLVQVSGKVTDETGAPLPGVNVVVKGTTKGTTTDTEGKYSLEVDGDNAVLVFSFIGYTSEEVVVGTQTTIDIALTPDITSLSEVVVVGYGTQSRKNLTSSITTVKTEDLNRGAISDVGQMLQGKVPGMNISRSGDPNRAAAIVLRGASTLREGAQSPLFVIDGVIGADISILAPDDIASIEVLKDAAATAIYGNRAANGVIMITTKRPDKGQAQVTYSGYLGIDKVSNQYDMMSATQLRDYLAKTGQSLAPADDLGADTDWQKEVQRGTAISHNHNISLGGGSDQTLYSASVNYFDQEGIIKSSGLKRVIARLSMEQKAIRDKLKLAFSVTNSISDAKYVPYRNTVLAQMLTYLPTVPVRNTDGTYYENPSNTGAYNPVAMLENGTERSKYNNLLGTMKAQLQLPFGLKYDMNMSYQVFQSNYGSYYNSYFTEHYNNVRNTPDPPGNPVFVVLKGRNGQAVRNSYKNTNKILETYLTWDKEFGNHALNVVLGYSWQENINGDGFQASSANFPVDNVSYNNLGLGNPYAISDFRVDFGPDLYEEVRFVSDFARFNYNYNDRYLLQASIRRDGSSVFGVNEQWGYFPSVGAAWRISQESFLQQSTLFDDLKLRVSYGVAGNSLGFTPYTTKLIYGSQGTYYYQGVFESAIGAIQNENPDLRWEKTATTNIGLDFSILKARVSGTLEVYDKRTTDLIFNYDVDKGQYPAQNGVLTANVGEMSNKGVEFTLNVAAVDKTDFSWNSTLNLAHNKNKIVSLSDEKFQRDTIFMVSPDGGGQSGETVQVLMEGQPIGQFYTYQYAGKDETGLSQYLATDGSLTTSPKSQTDYRLVGSPQPKLLLGWNNSFRYKNFDLNVFFRGVFGNKIMNVTGADLNRASTVEYNNLPVSAASESVADANSHRYSSRYVESGNYLRLDNATLGYNFRNLGQDLKRLRLYVSVNNLFVITNYTGIDPEINQGGIAPGVDARNFYPKTRTFLIGVNASF
jgi:TonB-linked SusC/RagA family outer membrane protein